MGVTVRVDLSDVSWPMLRDQKLLLLEILDFCNDPQQSALQGVIHLLDYIQDEAEKQGVPAADLFPPDPEPETQAMEVTYTFVVDVPAGQSPAEAVEEYVHSVSDPFSSPTNVRPVETSRQEYTVSMSGEATAVLNASNLVAHLRSRHDTTVSPAATASDVVAMHEKYHRNAFLRGPDIRLDHDVNDLSLTAEPAEDPNRFFSMYTPAGNAFLAAQVETLTDDIVSGNVTEQNDVTARMREIQIRCLQARYKEVQDTEPEWAIVFKVNAALNVTQSGFTVNREAFAR